MALSASRKALGLFMGKGLRSQSSRCSILKSDACTRMKRWNDGEPSLKQKRPRRLEYTGRAAKPGIQTWDFEESSDGEGQFKEYLVELNRKEQLKEYHVERNMNPCQKYIYYVDTTPQDGAAEPPTVAYA